MAIKTTNLKDDKGNPIELVLKQPAFLVGNGINLADGCEELRWDKLLFKILFNGNGNKNSEKVLKQKFKGLNYPEIAELAELYQKNESNGKGGTKINYDKTIKRQICEEIFRQEDAYKDQSECSEFFVRFCRDNKIPVLTTNFDHRLLLSLNITKEKSKNFGKKMIEKPFWTTPNNSSCQYPFSAYFAEKEIKPEKVRNEFAVCTSMAQKDI